MRNKRRARFAVVMVSLIVGFSMTFGSAAFAADKHFVLTADNQITLTPAKDETYLAQVIDQLGGEDGLYKEGLNGFDMYDNLGYVYMGWRTTGGIWQNQVIGDFIMNKLKDAGYETTDANVEAPYGTKPDSDKSSATDKDYAWEIQYQGTAETDLGNTWDPEFASLDVQLVKADDTPANDAVANDLAKAVGGEWWGYNPTTVTYQKYFAEAFGMNYETDIAALSTTSEKVKAMHTVLMKSDVDRDSRTSVDDYTYIKRDDIGTPNKEALLNQRTRMAWNSCFTDPAGTAPQDATGLKGEFVYVGAVDTANNTNSENVTDVTGKIILTDSSLRNGFAYAKENGAIGVASKTSVEGYLCPRDEDGKIMEPWYDSSRYARGGALNDTIAQTESGKPIVEWQFSNKQYDSMIALLKRAEEINATAATDADKVKVTANQIAIGQTYPMTKTTGKPGVGQAVAIAEVKGTEHPDKRVMICAHVQEPGCNDNATGVAALLGTATAYKKLIDAGKIERPKCTITFMWGDEMNMADYWMDGHPEETKTLIGSLDMDMTGEDPQKTGGVMRIEKTPDPSAIYGYTLDSVPWNEPDTEIPSKSNPYYDENYKSSWDGSFVRLPDSHTLWGAGDVEGLFDKGWYLNDLYMYVTSTVIDRHDPNFEVDVCPYEGGSDHSVFLERNIPAVLTWHFTDYVYHTSSDTLYMASPRELESVALTTLACGLVMSDACKEEAIAKDVMGAIKEAALKRMEAEKINTDHHEIYAKAGNQTWDEAFANEQEVLKAWSDWYKAAILSVLTMYDEPSADLQAAAEDAREELDISTKAGLDYAAKALDVSGQEKAAAKAKVKGLKVKSKKAKFTISWKKTAGASGYKVSYKLKSAKKWTTKTTTKTKLTTKKLKKGKKYQFKVQAYTKVKGKKISGPYTKVKNVKCK